MTKSKSFWAASALVSLSVAVFAAYSVYGRITLHLSGDTIEVRPVPMPPPQEEREETAEPAKPDGQEEAAEDKAEEAKSGKPAAAAPAGQEAQKPKAVKTLFEYKDAKARSVQIAGSFTSWKPKPMKKKAGVWRTEVYILPGTYPYHFKADGEKRTDPGKPRTPTGDSLVTVEPRN